MRVDLDARVQTRDGEDIGSVERAVIDPETNEITDFLIRAGELFGRDVLVPRGELERATKDGDILRLHLGKDEVDRMPTFVPSYYVTPPIEWQPPPHGYPMPGYLWPTGRDYPVRPVSPPPPPEGPDRVSINKGAVVLDGDGDEVGVVDDVRFDPNSGRLQGFVVRLGGALLTMLGGGDTADIQSDVVDRVEEGIVYLRVDKKEIKPNASKPD